MELPPGFPENIEKALNGELDDLGALFASWPDGRNMRDTMIRADPEEYDWLSDGASPAKMKRESRFYIRDMANEGELEEYGISDWDDLRERKDAYFAQEVESKDGAYH